MELENKDYATHKVMKYLTKLRGNINVQQKYIYSKKLDHWVSVMVGGRPTPLQIKKFRYLMKNNIMPFSSEAKSFRRNLHEYYQTNSQNNKKYHQSVKAVGRSGLGSYLTNDMPPINNLVTLFNNSIKQNIKINDGDLFHLISTERLQYTSR
jgi:hypothetical protein